jgi:hypothetical protein
MIAVGRQDMGVYRLFIFFMGTLEYLSNIQFKEENLEENKKFKIFFVEKKVSTAFFTHLKFETKQKRIPKILNLSMPFST